MVSIPPRVDWCWTLGRSAQVNEDAEYHCHRVTLPRDSRFVAYRVHTSREHGGAEQRPFTNGRLSFPTDDVVESNREAIRSQTHT